MELHKYINTLIHKYNVDGTKRSSTDDVEVVMCPASGSPGYYCNSDVSSNFFSSSLFFFILQQLAQEESVVYVFFLF